MKKSEAYLIMIIVYLIFSVSGICWANDSGIVGNTAALGSNPSINASIIAFNIYESSFDADINWDEDTDDSIIFYYDVSSGITINTRIVGDTPVVSGPIIAFQTWEPQVGQSLNDDDDQSDYVIRYYNVLTGELVNTMQTGLYPSISGSIIAFRTLEALSGIRYYDISTGETFIATYFGDKPSISGKVIAFQSDDNIIYSYTITTSELKDTGVIGTNPSISGTTIAFYTDESLAGDLNDDSDTNDRIIRYYDLYLLNLYNTKVIGDAPSISGDVIAFHSQEDLVGEDLNEDGDMDDTIIRLYEFPLKGLVNTAVNGKNVSINGSFMTFRTHEFWLGEDLNGDGDIFDGIIRYLILPDGLDCLPDQINAVHAATSVGCSTIPNTTSLYQSFKPSSDDLSGVDLRFRIGGSPFIEFDTDILIRDNTVGGVSLGSATSSVFGPQTSGKKIWTHFEFSPSVELVPGETYIVEWFSIDDTKLTWLASETDTYDGGNVFSCWAQPNTARDFIFRTCKKAITQTTEQSNDELTSPDIVSRWCSGESNLYQTFIPNATPLVGLDLYLTQGMNFPGNLFTSLNIREVVDSGGNLVLGNVIGSSMSYISTNDWGMIHFNFGPPIQVTPGELYAIEWVPSDINQALYWVSNASNTYVDGSAFGCGGLPLSSPEDFIFKTYTWEEANTPIGYDTNVQPTDSGTGSAPVSITFDEITKPGTTTLNISDVGEDPPFGFKLGNPPVYYEITTTADYSGNIKICIDFSGIDYGSADDLVLYHYENGQWFEAGSQTIVDEVICGIVSSISPFAVFREKDMEQVSIDIRPFSRRNIIIPWSRGLVPVAILSTYKFYAPDDVDKDSLTFGKTGNEESIKFYRRRSRDVNRDGLKDFVCFFRTSKAGFQCADDVGILRGITTDGVPIEGWDTVKVKCKKKSKKKKYFKDD